MNKLLKSGADMYLAVILPSSIQKSRNDPQGQTANHEGKRGSAENTSDHANKRENVQRSTGIDSSGVAGIAKRV